MKGTLYGLLGYPLGHSFSRNYFNNKCEAEDIDAEYINFEIPDINMLMEVISEYYNLNGLNVTIPYKEQVIPFLDELDEDAANIGAVNVIKIIHKNNISQHIPCIKRRMFFMNPIFCKYIFYVCSRTNQRRI